MTLPGISLATDGTDEWLFSRVHAQMFLQTVVVVASLVTQGTHEVGGLGVRCHVGTKGGTTTEGFQASVAPEVKKLMLIKFIL